jgi:hypothetical protein
MENEAEVTFTLFRIQIIKSNQLSLLNEDTDKKKIIISAINERPELTISEMNWHIGNIAELDNGDGIYFQVGKEFPKIQSVIDDESGDFLPKIDYIAPNTPVILDLRYQVAAIAANSELAQDTRSVAKKIKKLISSSTTIKQINAEFTIDPINDPMGFLEIIMSAEEVTKFQVTYGLPNVWDADDDFQKPFQKTTGNIGASESTAKFKGSNLNKGVIKSLTRAASVIGKRAKAWVKKEGAEKSVPITQESNQVTITSSLPVNSQDMRKQTQILEETRATYERVRQNE